MKNLVLLIFLLGTNALASHYDNAEVIDCRVTRVVDYTYFEEGLSSFEYPDIDVRVSRNNHYSVSIGSHRPYENSEGEQITIKTAKSGKALVHILRNEGDEIVLEVERRKTMAKLIVRVKQVDVNRFVTIAYGMCNRGL